MAAQFAGGFSSGPGPELMDLGDLRFCALPLICYEACSPATSTRATGAVPGF